MPSVLELRAFPSHYDLNFIHLLFVCFLFCVFFFSFFLFCSKFFFLIERAVTDETKLLFPSFHSTLSFVTNARLVLDVL